MIWLPSPSSHWKHSTSGHQELAGCQILGTRLGPHPDVFFEGSGLWQFFPVSRSLSLVPRTKSSPDICSLFFFFRKLLRAARCFSFHLPFPHFLSAGRQVKPTVFYSVFRFWVDSWHLRFSYSLHFEDCIHSCRECAITHPITPNSLLSAFSTFTESCHLFTAPYVLSFLLLRAHCCFLFQALIIPPLNSLHWSPARFPVSSHSQYSCKRCLQDQMPQWLPFTQGQKFKFLMLLLALGWVSHLASSSFGCNLRSISTESLVFLKPLLVISHLRSDCCILDLRLHLDKSHTPPKPQFKYGSPSPKWLPTPLCHHWSSAHSLRRTQFTVYYNCLFILFHTEDSVSFLTVFSGHSTLSISDKASKKRMCPTCMSVSTLCPWVLLCCQAC